MKPTQRLSIYALLMILDGIILATMFFWMLDIISGMYGSTLLHVLSLILIVLISSTVIQIIPTVLAKRYPALSNRYVMGLRYAYVIPYSIAMYILARVSGSYLVLSMIIVVLFITYLKWIKPTRFPSESKHQTIRHVVLTSFIIFLSFILTLLSVFMR